MKKLTKVISLLAVMLMILSLLSGCITVNNPAPEDNTTVEEKVAEQADKVEQNTENATQQNTDNANQQTQNAGGNNAEGIGEEAALDIALKDAGFSKSDVSNTWVELDMDDGRMEYDVKFYNGTTEYEYSIDAGNGTILSKDIDND